MSELDYKNLSYTPNAFTNKSNDKVFAAAEQAAKVAQEKTRLMKIIAAYTPNPDTVIALQKQKDLIRTEEKNLSTYSTQLRYYLALPEPKSAATLKAITDLNAKVTKSKQVIETAKNKIKTITQQSEANKKKADQARKALNALNKTGVIPPVTDNGNGGSGDSKDDKSIKIYFNAPMVKSAYTDRGIQVDVAGRSDLITSPGAYENARNAWKDVGGAKGAIQTSRRFADVSSTPQNGKSVLSYIKDDKNYGFRFLYNPSTVNMAWGIVEQFSPQFEASGQDKATALSVGLMKSAISFELYLNRIGDMAFLDSNGLKASTVTQTNGVNYITQQVPQFNIEDIYAGKVPPEDLALIYERGTMYDLEYLFRTVGGHNSRYKANVLGGETSDKGWLMPIPVELHLGSGLRYLVRVSQLDVQHIIFNERMVPLWTQVTVTCTRYYDGPEMYSSKESASDALNKWDTFNTGG